MSGFGDPQQGEDSTMLTRKQFELLRFIHERLKEAGVPPSFDEMKDALDLRSKSGIHRLITALEERGFIRRLPNRARAIEVIKLPESVAHGIGRRAASRRASSRATRQRVRAASEDDGGRPVAVPVMGRIAAGTPIEAIQTRSHTINMPPDLLAHRRAFRARGARRLMIEAGILDGDIALIKKPDAADTGDIVVALIDDEEATLKRFRRRGASIALEPPTPPTRSASPPNPHQKRRLSDQRAIASREERESERAAGRQGGPRTISTSRAPPSGKALYTRGRGGGTTRVASPRPGVTRAHRGVNFYSWEQCMATISGIGGYCALNQFEVQPRGEKRRTYRRQHYY